MLYDKLISIYQRNEFLRTNYDFELYYRRLSQYISLEVNQGNDYLSPFRFAKMFDDNLEDMIKFFLSISSPSDEGFVRIVYKYKCEDCGSLNFFSSSEVLDENLVCGNCTENVFGNYFNNDQFVFVFELSKNLKDEFKCLKVKTLSKNDADIGRGISVNQASDLIKERPEINPQLSEVIQDYWDIVHG